MHVRGPPARMCEPSASQRQPSNAKVLLLLLLLLLHMLLLLLLRPASVRRPLAGPLPAAHRCPLLAASCPAAGVLDEKCAATSSLGYYASAVPGAFMQYLPAALDTFTRSKGGMCRWAGVRNPGCAGLGGFQANRSHSGCP